MADRQKCVKFFFLAKTIVRDPNIFSGSYHAVSKIVWIKSSKYAKLSYLVQ